MVNDPHTEEPLGGPGGPGNRPPQPQFSGRTWLIVVVLIVVFNLLVYALYLPYRQGTLLAAGHDRADGPGATPYFRPTACGQVRPDQGCITFCGCCDSAFVRCAAHG